MRIFLLVLVGFGGFLSGAQAQGLAIGPAVPLVTYKDTVNHFEMRVPRGWFLGIEKEGISPKKLFMFRHDSTDHPYEHFMFEVDTRKNSTLAVEEGRLEAALRATNDFDLQEKGSVTVSGLRWIWFVETHQRIRLYNTRGPEVNYEFVAYRHGKTYVLTFSATPESFPKYRGVYDQVMRSLVLD